MDQSIWFYTFSTAAQVIAALIGLFAVFVVYKIQDSTKLFDDARFALSRLIPTVSSNVDGPERVTREEFNLMSDREILESFARLLFFENEGNLLISHENINNVSFQINRTTYDYVFKLLTKKNAILRKFVSTLALSFSAITLCLISLVLTSFLITHSWYVYFSLVFFVICFP